jgi:crotonobetainyl-CoA:carnitine CoA-transferase CaiB-like acyl-CoA transferase
VSFLHGVRVLDLSRILAGPWCTQLLADFGADVVKIEKPQEGDDTRQWGPPFLHGTNGEDVAAYFLGCNRGKRSVTVDFTQAEGATLLRALAVQAHVLVENFRPGTLAKYGLDYASLKALNPRLVYCSISGFGQDGPNTHRAGYDAMIQAEAGLMSVTGVPDDLPGAGPAKVGVAVSDLMCGMYASSAILAALQAAAQSGLGAWLDIPLFDTQVAWLANQGMNFLVSGRAPTRLGTAHPNIAPYQVFATADGYLMLAVGNDLQFRRFSEAADCAALADDARFLTNAARVVHRNELITALAPVLLTRTTHEWQSLLARAGVPCGPVNDLAEVFAHPQTLAHELRFHMAHPQLGPLPQIANPVRRDGVSLCASLPPPRLGEHTDAVLGELGLDAAAIALLRAAGAVG